MASVFVRSEKLADPVIRRVIHRNHRINNCGYVNLAGTRIYWCLRCLVNNRDMYEQPLQLESVQQQTEAVR